MQDSLTLPSNWAFPSLLIHLLLPNKDAKKIGEAEVRELMDGYKDSLLMKQNHTASHLQADVEPLPDKQGLYMHTLLGKT